MFAVRALVRQKLPLDRDTLRAPFYAQCCVAAPAAFSIGIGTILGRAHSTELQVAGVLVSLAAVAKYICVETVWLKRQAGMASFPATRAAFNTWLLASILNSFISVAVLGS